MHCHLLRWTFFVCLIGSHATQASEPFLIKDGIGRAEIILAVDSPRTARLAAQELQGYLEKISGAKLPIENELHESIPVKIYVGHSSFTDKLEITAKDLKNGAYRIVSGDNWLALIGDDTNFTPIEPWSKNNSDWVSGRVHAEWDKITGGKYGNPLSQLHKHYTGSTSQFGKPDADLTDKQGNVHVWGFDERGSFNAVCGYLRGLGVRWYMPGDIGEVVPSMKSIPLPKVNETVQPDFAIRRFNIRFGVHGRDTAMWAMRLGMRDPYGLQIAHGMHTMTHRDEILEAHPDWFALYGGKRQNQPGQRLNQLCYSNEELFQETLRYVRAQYDHYKFDVVSVMPPDGYVAICQCPLCEGKDSPERDNRGQLSDYVWDFVNRVAKEIKKTHPDKMISNCAYGVYTLPPEKIEKLESNVLVCIVGGRRPTSNRPEQQAEIRKLREGWTAKTDNPIMVFENYPFTDRGWYLPSFVPHALGDSINATKGISQGEDIWLSVRQDFDKVAIGYNHFPVYFTARMYWGGKDQDVEAMFAEYCHLFYGPAGEAMKAFFEYCELNWQEIEKDQMKLERAMELFHAAEEKAGLDSLYSQRIALIADYLKSLQDKGVQLAQERGPVPQLRLARDAHDIVIDGKLDDDFWEGCLSHAVGQLRELQTGRKPIYGTTFKAAWGKDGCLYFAIRCEEQEDEPLAIGTKRNEDQATWYGDVVEVLLETEAHSYYQLAVNPAGALVDLDRGAGKKAGYAWDSQAEVATRIANDHWTVEMRIPIVQDENDPLHQVVGRKPTSSLPWHFNVCRQRVRETGAEYSAFSPTGTASFHEKLKFAHLYEGRSHKFEHEETDDFLARRGAAFALVQHGERYQAISALAKLAEGKITDFQKTDLLEHAANLARSLKEYQRAAKLADQIPLSAPAKTVRMWNLLEQRKAEELIEQYQSEDLKTWPFWNAGSAYFARGQAFSMLGEGRKADEDLHLALAYTTDTATRLDILHSLGANYEKILLDDEAALKAYQEMNAATRNNGSATYFRGLLDAARLLRKSGKPEEAVATLNLVEINKLSGYWRNNLLLAMGETLHVAGKKMEALQTYQEILKDEAANGIIRTAAERGIKLLQENDP